MHQQNDARDEEKDEFYHQLQDSIKLQQKQQNCGDG